jgi:HlyD family secretion protein
VIIDRRVNIGQTVVSSLNAPSLFLIAKDLTRMQVWVSVNEADIGNIHPGQAASFTVDAYPGEVFQGAVGKIRLNATMTQNVVTYTVEVITDNTSGRLFPYLTANVEFELGRRRSVLLVPNAALRWFPRPEQVAPKFRKKTEAAFTRGDTGQGERVATEAAAPPTDKARQAFLWTPDGKSLRPITVRADLSDGTLTEVEGDELKEGLAVVVGEQPQAINDSGTNPFTPQVMRGNRPPERQ